MKNNFWKLLQRPTYNHPFLWNLKHSLNMVLYLHSCFQLFGKGEGNCSKPRQIVTCHRAHTILFCFYQWYYCFGPTAKATLEWRTANTMVANWWQSRLTILPFASTTSSYKLLYCPEKATPCSSENARFRKCGRPSEKWRPGDLSCQWNMGTESEYNCSCIICKKLKQGSLFLDLEYYIQQKIWQCWKLVNQCSLR